MPECRQAVAHAVGRGISQRRACTLLGVARSALSYQSVLARRDAPARPRDERRPLPSAVEAERAAGAAPPAQTKNCGGRPRLPTPQSANHVWAYDFVYDACANGQQLKCLTVVDEYTRECLAIDDAGTIRSLRVIEVLSRLMAVHGTPACLRSDNGPEFVSRAILTWIVDSGVRVAHIDPSKP